MFLNVTTDLREKTVTLALRMTLISSFAMGQWDKAAMTGVCSGVKRAVIQLSFMM